MTFLIMLLIGAAAGWLAGKIVEGYGFGLIGNIVVGIVGAFIAGLILPRIGLSVGGGMDCRDHPFDDRCGDFPVRGPAAEPGLGGRWV